MVDAMCCKQLSAPQTWSPQVGAADLGEQAQLASWYIVEGCTGLSLRNLVGTHKVNILMG